MTAGQCGFIFGLTIDTFTVAMTLAGLGGGAILLSSLFEALLVAGMDVLLFLRWLGLFAGLLLFIAALFLQDPTSFKAGSVKIMGKPGIWNLPFSIFAIGNALGRIVWGHISDHLGYKSIPISRGIFALLGIQLLITLPKWFLFTIVGFLGFGFGANFVIFAFAVTRFWVSNLLPDFIPSVFWPMASQD